MTTIIDAAPLRFLADSHQYWLGGRQLPSVTAILTAVGAIDSDWYTDASKRRGTWVHEATALLDRGELDADEAQVRTPEYWPYVAAYQAFLKDAQPDICDVECRVHDDLYGYAGTLDRTLFLNGRWSLLDLKTGSPARWHRLQTAAYARLRLNDGRTPDRYVLYLKPDGTYRLSEPCTDRQDEAIFLSAVTWAAWTRGGAK